MREYLFLKRHSLDNWRTLAETTHSSQFKRLLRQADSHHADLPPPDHPSDSITYIGTAVLNLALAHLLTGDAAYLDTARRWIKSAIAYPHWGKERMPDHDLDAAWLLFGLGLGYDWLKDALPADERDALRDKLYLHGRRLYAYALATEGRWWSSAYWQNHNWICYGGLATAAYALCAEYSEAGSWAARASDNYAQALSLMPEDGSNYEGPVYWRYGVIWFLIYAHLLLQETGEDLHDSGFLRNTFFYRLYLSGPNLVDTANFGDCHDRRSAHTAAVYARLAGLYNIGEAQWLYHHFDASGEWEREGAEGLVKPGLWAESGLEFLWYDPAIEGAPIADLPLSRIFPDLGLATMRSSWDRTGVTMTFKCGAPNGLKAWHSGQELNRQRAWQTLNAGHDHPDANSFIIISGDDYVAVDDGYAKEKRSRHHSTLLIDGRGQYAEGSKNAFRDLDATWSARLEASLECGDVVYIRGEAARAYAPDLRLRQFAREAIFLAGDAVVLRDTIASEIPHDYQWLLQTDVPPEADGRGSFKFTSGATPCQLRALQPAGVKHEVLEQEISANPTSAKPDWIIRRTQYALALSPAEACRDCQYFVVLDLAGFHVQSLPAERGLVATLSTDRQQWTVAFASGRDGIQAANPNVNVDGAWFAGRKEDGQLSQYLAGDVTSIWLDGELHFVADRPVDITWRQVDDRICVTISARDDAWLRLKSDKPAALHLNGGDCQFQHDAATGMIWVRVGAGKSELEIL